MKKRMMIAVLGCVVFATTTFAGHHNGGHHDKVKLLTKKLDLTSEQVVQVEQFRQELLKPKAEMKEQRKAIRDQLHALDINAANYEDQLAEIAASAGQHASEAATNRIMFKGKMKRILTSEQQEKLAKMSEKRHKREKHHKQMNK